MTARRWLHSAPFDLGLLIGPPLLAALAVLLVPALRARDTPIWAWVVFVVGVDVAHVYASLYRVYWDPAELARRRALYVGLPLACFAASVLLFARSPLWFWRVLAYVAVFHFVRQQYGFMRLYQKLGGRSSRLDEALDSAAIYSTMLYPLIFWHASGDRRFSWFVDGDFVNLPSAAAKTAFWGYALILVAFAARQFQLMARGEPPSAGKVAVVASTAAAWYVGVVMLNSDLAFTVTNVVAHGLPYFALVWLCGRRRWESDGGWRGLVFKPAAWMLYLLPLLVLAYCEEGLWDWLVWREHSVVFAGTVLNRHGLALTPASGGWLNLIVPLLAVPQTTHYALDAWIWRLDGTNPGLARDIVGAAA